jgi:hypothetical protein
MHKENLLKRFCYSIFVLCLALTSVAFPQEKTQAAEKAAAEWLKLVDFDAYEKSWKQASPLLRAAVKEILWEQKLKAVRTPMGAVLSRQLKSAEYKTHLPGVPDGEYVVIQYKTSFEHKQMATETVVPALDKEGHWRVSGYSVK